MLGSLADAEDIVHDTFLKWLTIDTSRIQNTKAFLVRTVKIIPKGRLHTMIQAG
jgi:RNA polymerase sigma-70 factor (ECF subfamily)